MSKVSVIVPVHNTEKYIGMCVSSLLAQTLKDIEVILVENGSSDGSLKECQRMAQSDPRVKVIHLDKGDVSVARNVGIENAVSDYVGFVDSDDTVDAEMYETLYGLAVDNDLDVMYSNHVMIYDNKPPKYYYSNDGSFVVMDSKELLKLHYMHKLPSSACTMIARKSLFDEIKFPEGTWYEDRSITYLLLNRCRRGGHLNKAFYKYYQRKGSTVHTWDFKHCYDAVDVERRRLEFLRDSDMFSEQEKAVMGRMPSMLMLRRLRRLRSTAKSLGQKQAYSDMARNIDLIPDGCNLTLKTRLIRAAISVNSYFKK